MGVPERIRQCYVNSIKDYSDNEDMDYDIFLRDCLYDIKTKGIKSLDTLDALILAELFFERIYKTRSRQALDAAVTAYHKYKISSCSNRDVYKLVTDMIKIYKDYD